MDRFRTHQHFLLFSYVRKRKATSLAKEWVQVLRDFMIVGKVVGFYDSISYFYTVHCLHVVVGFVATLSTMATAKVQLPIDKASRSTSDIGNFWVDLRLNAVFVAYNDPHISIPLHPRY